MYRERPGCEDERAREGLGGPRDFPNDDRPRPASAAANFEPFRVTLESPVKPSAAALNPPGGAATSEAAARTLRGARFVFRLRGELEPRAFPVRGRGAGRARAAPRRAWLWAGAAIVLGRVANAALAWASPACFKLQVGETSQSTASPSPQSQRTGTESSRVNTILRDLQGSPLFKGNNPLRHRANTRRVDLVSRLPPQPQPAEKPEM